LRANRQPFVSKLSGLPGPSQARKQDKNPSNEGLFSWLTTIEEVITAVKQELIKVECD
jgi:hypothetical protein